MARKTENVQIQILLLNVDMCICVINLSNVIYSKY